MYGLDRNKPYDVVAIGNAILDVLSFTDDAFLQRFNLKKGAMTLIDADEAKRLYEHMGDSREVSGGSAANTLAGMASLGARTAFIGKICDDQLGAIYRHDLRAVGVDFDTPASTAGKPTGCSYILVTPDAERTMNTYLGAGSDVDPADVDETLVARAKIFYGEGYQWSTEQTKSGLRKAFASAKQHGSKIAFTLSDVFCVEGSRDEFLGLIDSTFDILFANENEVKALFPGKEWNDILDALKGKMDTIVITRGEQGSIILNGDERIEVAAKPVKELVDTTGAGDLYAAGFLYGYVHALPLKQCGELGSACAAEIIQHLGARSMKPLKELLAA